MDPEAPDPSQRTLALEVMAVRWASPDGLFAVVAGVTDEGEEVVVTGALGHVHEGESLTVQGAWRRHARHGWQFVAERVRLGAPASEAALLSYLASVKHVGRAGRRGCSSGTARRRSWPRSTATPTARCAPCPGSGPRASVRR